MGDEGEIADRFMTFHREWKLMDVPLRNSSGGWNMKKGLQFENLIQDEKGRHIYETVMRVTCLVLKFYETVLP
jgi:hypothetical protein